MSFVFYCNRRTNVHHDVVQAPILVTDMTVAPAAACTGLGWNAARLPVDATIA